MITEDGGERAGNLLITDEAAVGELVKELSNPMADLARLIHRDRPLYDPEQGFRDHDVYANVVDGFGYLSHQDRDHGKAYPVGDPESAGCEFDDDDFPAGSGLPLDQFTAALVEFLRTTKRPTNVQWTGQ
ncbi:Imm1 family immunity protein [Saccharopolyspora pogona]|uniref:Imm1 family immunity protein n=1 Tax=Saccharopolyspora pogona TaxID=333966 RepID=UPI001CC227CD|nr:Imm1 family immunity protein [Saccharopolyspora pogona]